MNLDNFLDDFKDRIDNYKAPSSLSVWTIPSNIELQLDDNIGAVLDIKGDITSVQLHDEDVIYWCGLFETAVFVRIFKDKEKLLSSAIRQFDKYKTYTSHPTKWLSELIKDRTKSMNWKRFTNTRLYYVELIPKGECVSIKASVRLDNNNIKLYSGYYTIDWVQDCFDRDGFMDYIEYKLEEQHTETDMFGHKQDNFFDNEE